MPSEIGMFASVLDAVVDEVKPSALPAASAVCTIGAESAWPPVGRMPIVSTTSEIFAAAARGPGQRAFSAASASWMMRCTCASTSASDFASSERMSTSIDASPAIELTDVPPWITPTLKVVLGFAGTWMSEIARDRAAERVDRIGNAERAVAVAARSFVGDAIAMAADRAARDAEPRVVDGDEVVDFSFELFAEQIAHAAQVARPFLADVADEVDGAVGLHAGFLERADDGENDGEPAVVVADARRAELSAVVFDGDVGAFGEDGVEVSGDDDRRPGADAAPLGDDVAGGVDADVLEAERFEALFELSAAFGFFERRRGDGGQLDLLLERPGVVGLEDVEGGADFGVRRGDGELGEGGRRGEEERGEGEAGGGWHGTNVLSRRVASEAHPGATPATTFAESQTNHSGEGPAMPILRRDVV